MTAPALGPRELARLTGVSTDTLRHYERKGLLPAVMRTQAGYRRYPAVMVDRVLLIQRALVVGFTLTISSRCWRSGTRAARPAALYVNWWASAWTPLRSGSTNCLRFATIF